MVLIDFGFGYSYGDSYDYQCVTIPKIWTKPNPKLFSDTKFFRYRIRYFFQYRSFSDTDTFFDTKIFRTRYRYFFRYQIFSKPIPILFKIPTNFETDTDTIATIGKVAKPRSLEIEMSHSDNNKSLWFHDLALFLRLFFNVCFQMFPQIACLWGCKVTLVAFGWLFSTVSFQMSP